MCRCRFDIGQVVIINYHFDIEVLMSKCTTPSKKSSKLSVQHNHSEIIRHTFKENPILQYKIVLTDDTLTTIT